MRTYIKKDDIIPEVVATIILAITETRTDTIKEETENDRVFNKIVEFT